MSSNGEQALDDIRAANSRLKSARKALTEHQPELAHQIDDLVDKVRRLEEQVLTPWRHMKAESARKRDKAKRAAVLEEDEARMRLGERFVLISNLNVNHNMTTVDAAYQDPRSEEKTTSMKASELFSIAQREFVLGLLKDDDKPRRFSITSRSVFTSGSNYGDATILLFFERDGQRFSWLLFDDATPPTGIKTWHLKNLGNSAMAKPA